MLYLEYMEYYDFIWKLVAESVFSDNAMIKLFFVKLGKGFPIHCG